MNTIIITGSAGLVGSEAVRFYAAREFRVVGIDNDMRSQFFGPEASTVGVREMLQAEFPEYIHVNGSIIDSALLADVFEDERRNIVAVIHAAGQPSHDWAASDPHIDFSVNAYGTLSMLEATRRYAHRAAFVFTSTNKVYGDTPNQQAIFEQETRYENAYFADFGEKMEHGIGEWMSVDACTHSLFGASKLAADILVQEYGRYFGMNTAAFRCGCLTGAAHAGAKQHGFLSYLVRCAMTDTPYEIIGYKGKQVRDNLHAADLVQAFDAYIRNPKPGAVYNIGGGRVNSCSVIEAIRLVEQISGRKLRTTYNETARLGDHRWWITDTRKFQRDYPEWRVTRNLEQIIGEMVNGHIRQAA